MMGQEGMNACVKVSIADIRGGRRSLHKRI